MVAAGTPEHPPDCLHQAVGRVLAGSVGMAFGDGGDRPAGDDAPSPRTQDQQQAAHDDRRAYTCCGSVTIDTHAGQVT
jgi:hypothetical protein